MQSQGAELAALGLVTFDWQSAALDKMNRVKQFFPANCSPNTSLGTLCSNAKLFSGIPCGWLLQCLLPVSTPCCNTDCSQANLAMVMPQYKPCCLDSSQQQSRIMQGKWRVLNSQSCMLKARGFMLPAAEPQKASQRVVPCTLGGRQTPHSLG